ncbi:MAG: DUF445 family protein [Acutalibacteraceae bacterium]|nr:DUF445 family protein [Acutalibacteraceae bacterium]
MILKYFITPVIASVIGYGTNYVAVKMLFHPRNEIKFMGRTLPFTPGAIPKGKPRLAKAVGDVVGNTLITKEDITEKLLDEKIEHSVTEKIGEILNVEIKKEVMTLSKIDDEKYDSLKNRITDTVTDKIMAAVLDFQIGKAISAEAGKTVKEKLNNPMIRMIITDELIDTLTRVIGDEVQKYVVKNGPVYISAMVGKKISEIENRTTMSLLEGVSITREKTDNAVSEVYHNAVNIAVDELFSMINISKIIEDKINAMNMDQLEGIVLKVMKKELDTIVNLGAVIGLLLGIVNMFINMLLS